ncbi:hypothetical protein F5Y17DRAFT_474657 [Xylariaceae sp. FL0594]|nr:hypothetical protein F5Y17DRAFT_474657 [Xylariaceae sp. FL0594]
MQPSASLQSEVLIQLPSPFSLLARPSINASRRFVVSLLDPTLTEEDLGSLFTSLPRRCIVLLEDIDTAGLRRTGEEKAGVEEKPADAATADEKERAGSTSNEGDTNKKSTSLDIKELAKALKKESEDQQKGISLSGLLNAIDGVASHEGRVLIMTTNIPESLDPALIRPGRVDLQVQFTNATTEQATELFIRMYEVEEGRPRIEAQPSPISSSSSSPSSSESTPSHEKTTTTAPEQLEQLTNGNNDNSHLPPSSPTTLSAETEATLAAGALRTTRGSGDDRDLGIAASELPDYARQFGDKIPAGEFSPAEIQGYLLKRKKTPRRAVEEAEKWVAALLQQKANKSKIVQVQ